MSTCFNSADSVKNALNDYAEQMQKVFVLSALKPLIPMNFIIGFHKNLKK